uniref:Uncharacterized protein n=1 Tax=Picea glauca TaxID=3330 RepID=A0A101M071_PICGL|nr:hypothetical protein ABT39_MTgene4644 [Picea glauca]QHR86520.1 hypothetical protein Q903MT_gene522 [Picea sitchensis]
MGLKQRMLLGRLLLLSQPDQPLALLIIGIRLGQQGMLLARLLPPIATGSNTGATGSTSPGTGSLTAFHAPARTLRTDP